MKRLSLFKVALIALTLGLLLVACGGDAQEAPPNDTNNGTNQEEPTPTAETTDNVDTSSVEGDEPAVTFVYSGLVDQTYDVAYAEANDLTYAYQFFIDDFTQAFYQWDAVFRNNDFTLMSRVIFYVSADIEPGTYDVAYAPSGNNKVPEGFQVGARITYKNDADEIDFNADTINGTFTIDIDDRNLVNNTFQLVGTNEDGDTINASGSFQNFENRFETEENG